MSQNPTPIDSFLPGQTYPELYTAHFEDKCSFFEQQLQALCTKTTNPVGISRFPSNPQGYRMRAEFRIWHQDDQIHYAMMNPGKDKTPRMIDAYLPGSLLIQATMPPLLAELSRHDLLKKQLFQLEFLSSLKGEMLITLIYHRTLDDAWLHQAQQLKATLSQSITKVDIVGRSRGQKICVAQDFIYESFTVADTTYEYQQIEGSFTQPNAIINEKMLNWANRVTKNIGGDLLELYCGNGNFTLPLAKNFNKVLATEVSKTSIQAALHNIAINHVSNIEIARLSSEEAAQAIARLRPFNRLAHLDLDAYQFSTIFVDPPRAGLDTQTLIFVKNFDNICYISCNPETLIENLHTLTLTHQIKQIALFDQFPYTPHMECGVLLSKNSG